MSERISGVKNLVAYGVSFIRELPVSHVKSAKANGSDFGLEGSIISGFASGRTGGGPEAFADVM